MLLVTWLISSVIIVCAQLPMRDWIISHWLLVYEFFISIKKIGQFFNFQEIDCIVNQMMSVAEYLGWDVSELKPVSSRISHHYIFKI